jgi:hypothetical protein
MALRHSPDQQPRGVPMPQSPSQNPDDPFDGLLLPISAWKTLEDAKITSLEQLKTIAPGLEQIRGMDPETAQIIKDRLDCLAARRTVRVRLIFPKRPHRKVGRKRNNHRKQEGAKHRSSPVRSAI